MIVLILLTYLLNSKLKKNNDNFDISIAYFLVLNNCKVEYAKILVNKI